MKNLLQLDGINVTFYEPYFVYDIVTIFDKTKNAYVNRRRASAISYSQSGEIILATAICSEQDIFSKKQARKILLNRVKKLVNRVEVDSFNLDYLACNDNCFYFSHYSMYDEYCNMFDKHATLFFTPYHVSYLDRVENKWTTSTKLYVNVQKKLDTLSNSVASVYLQKNFISTTYHKFMNVLHEDNTIAHNLQKHGVVDIVTSSIDVYSTPHQDTDSSASCDVD